MHALLPRFVLSRDGCPLSPQRSPPLRLLYDVADTLFRRHAFRHAAFMADSPILLLRAHARHAPWNARGLAAHVTALVDAAGVRPTNASARAAPSARSIRFYIANGLLSRPEGAGTSATYNYRHFLQLMAIKIRQREGATLDAIKKEMDDAPGDSLERRVATSLAAALGATIETRRTVSDEENPASWRRLPVADGVELHVRDNSPASRDEALVAMREAVRAALGREDIR
jgi:DNA-binding transcriptional MerR regulator